MKILFLVLLAFTFFGCAEDDAPSSNSVIIPAIIIPLQVGNSWTYTMQSFDSAGNQTSFPNKNMLILKDTAVGGWMWFVNNDSALVMVRDDGFWSLHSGETPQMEAKYPVKNGDTYKFRTDSVFVTSTASSLTTPKGNYSCIRYHHIHYADGVKLDIETDEYYAVNIGLVGVIEHTITPSGTQFVSFQSLLIDFVLK